MIRYGTAMSQTAIQTSASAPGQAASGAGGAWPSERRIAPRYPFTATAEIAGLHNSLRITARTTDISTGGCYIDTTVPFPSGDPVRIRITKGGRHFEARAKVCYSQQGMGMGLQFMEIPPVDAEVLHRWLAELRGELAPALDAPEVAAAIQQFSRNERHVLTQLISALIRKRILTEHEGGVLLRELTE
jgi:hypothetical protein